MKRSSTILGAALAAALLAGGWVLVFHGEWVKRAPHEEEEEKVDTEVSVRVAKCARATLHRYVDGYGLVSPEPAQGGKPPASAQLASPVAGVLAKASCAEGDHVEKGAELFQLDVRAAAAEEQKAGAAEASASAVLARLRSIAEYAERDLERAKKLKHEGLSSEKDLYDAELRALSTKNDLVEAQAKAAEAHQGLTAAQTQRALLSIRAPLSGTVVRVYVSPGEAVNINPSTIIADLVDLDRLIIAATIPATELPSLALGQPVELYVAERGQAAESVRARAAGDEKPDAAPSREAPSGARVHRGSLAFIGLAVDMKTDTVPIRVAFPRDAGLRPGQYLRVRVVVEERADRLAVPIESVVAAPEGGHVVSVVDGDKATQRPVRVGLREGGLVEIEGEGLKEGVTVVAAGAYGLPKETRVKVIGAEP